MQIFFRLTTFACAVLLALAYVLGVDVATLPSTHNAVTFLDRNGATLGTILPNGSARSNVVTLDNIAPDLQRAILAAEDSRFYSHGAVDLRGLLRAAREFVIYGEFESGGSTIAMQLARLLHPSPATWRGKLVQIARAERLAMRSQRADLFAAYLNRAPMGGNLYGVEAASRAYFGTPARDVDLAQAALLAAIPNDPAELAPDAHPDAARGRVAYVLRRMNECGWITQPHLARAAHEHITVATHDNGIGDAPHALFALYPTVAQPRVRTTIDRGLQRFVQAQVEDVVATLAPLHVTDAAALVVDNRTGDVLAYVGSPDYFSDAALGRNDGVRALRQPGSSLKPFMYELALERRVIRSTTILPDVPASFSIPGGKLYQPADYSGRFSGPVRVRFALANSLNVPAVRTLSALGTDTFLERLHELGFSGLNKPANYYGLGLTLGGGEVTLWDNVQAYETMARRGDALPLHLLPQPTIMHQHIGDPATWSLVTDMLADRNVRAFAFGTHSVLDEPFAAAVKTGTSSDFRDTWTIGFTRDYTVGVWVGNFDGSAMRNVSGVTGAGPLWNRIMLHLHEREAPANFSTPSDYARVRICATTGHAPTSGCPAVVQEWVRKDDVADVRRPVSPLLGRDYDAWLATTRASAFVRSVRIVKPRDNATYYDGNTELALAATGAHGPMHWTVDGKNIESDAEGNGFWKLALGTHTIVVRDGVASDRVAIQVVRAPSIARPGFTRRGSALAGTTPR